MRRRVQEAMGHIHRDSIVPGANLVNKEPNPDQQIIQENKAPFTIKPGLDWESVDRLRLPPEERTVAIGSAIYVKIIFEGMLIQGKVSKGKSLE